MQDMVDFRLTTMGRSEIRMYHEHSVRFPERHVIEANSKVNKKLLLL